MDLKKKDTQHIVSQCGMCGTLKYVKWCKKVTSPLSHLAHGLFQASPSVAQQWDFSVAPLMLTSQRLLTILSQQVLLVVSVYIKQIVLVTHIVYAVDH